VEGSSQTSIGVHGTSDSGNGVFGASHSGAGVAAGSQTGTAVFALSGTGTGVSGLTGGGLGVSGIAGATGVGVSGSGGSAGVKGTSSAGIGVLASGQTALSVQGPAVFSRSGTLTIAAGSKSATKSGVALTAASLVLVTAQTDVAGAVVRSAVPNVVRASFTVHLAKAIPKALTLGWFIVN
jgi:hypothetical protein